jgi:hypothetical protein
MQPTPVHPESIKVFTAGVRGIYERSRDCDGSIYTSVPNESNQIKSGPDLTLI